MRIFFTVRLELEGIYIVPECDLSTVVYLNQDRHTFGIECTLELSHGNRGEECIGFKENIQQYIKTMFFDETNGCCNFGPMSLQHIAEVLLIQYSLDRCSVSGGEFTVTVENK
jgi:hypothetical protein